MTMQHAVAGAGLADVLERILDKGIVVAGDVAVSLVGVELLTYEFASSSARWTARSNSASAGGKPIPP